MVNEGYICPSLIRLHDLAGICGLRELWEGRCKCKVGAVGFAGGLGFLQPVRFVQLELYTDQGGNCDQCGHGRRYRFDRRRIS